MYLWGKCGQQLCLIWAATYLPTESSNTVECVRGQRQSCWDCAHRSTVLSRSLVKTCFAWHFILNENILFWLTILSETICLFCFCVLFSNMYPKIKFTAKAWSNQYNFYSKVIFWNFCLRIFFFSFLCWIWIIDVSQQYSENFRTIGTSESCWKSACKLPALQVSA